MVHFLRRVVQRIATSMVLGAWALAPAVSMAQAPPTTVQLLSPGSGPLQPLRFRPKAGKKGSAEMRLTVALSMDMLGVPMPQEELPAARMVLDTRVQRVDPGGDIQYTFHISDAGVVGGPSDATAGVHEELARNVGTTGAVTVTDRGIVKVSETKPPPGVEATAFDSLSSGLSLASAPFPEEPVGVGASWRAVQDLTSNGVSVRQESTYTLQSRKGHNAVIQVAVVQTAEPHEMTLPGLPPGSAWLNSLTGSGSGEVTWDLRNVMPATARVTSKTDAQFTVRALGTDQPSRIVMEVGVALDRP